METSEIQSLISSHPAFASMDSNVAFSFVGGSAARGWAHSNSDIDVYIVTNEPMHRSGWALVRTDLDPPFVSNFRHVYRTLEIDFEVWTLSQVLQTVDKIPIQDSEESHARGVTSILEIDLLERLGTGICVVGLQQFRETQALVKTRDFAGMLCGRSVGNAKSALSDAEGFARDSRITASLLATRAAYEFAVDAALLSQNITGRGAKWIPDRLAANKYEPLNEDSYWETVSFKGLDLERPMDWISRVIRNTNGLLAYATRHGESS